MYFLEVPDGCPHSQARHADDHHSLLLSTLYLTSRAHGDTRHEDDDDINGSHDGGVSRAASIVDTHKQEK